MPSQSLRGLKIARVSTVAFFVETQLHAQISSIAQSGAEVVVVASEAGLERPISQTRYASVQIPRKISPVKDLLALVNLYTLFRREHFDIVHSTTPKAGLLCAISAFAARVPVRLHTFTGQPWAGLTGIKFYLSKYSDRLISRLNTYCLADSASQREFIINAGVAGADSIGVLGAGSLAGIDLNRFCPTRFSPEDNHALKNQLGVPPDCKVLLFVGRLTRDKGLAELLSSFEELHGQRPIVLVLVGPAETDVEQMLAQLPDAVNKRIICAGFTVEPERYMAMADLLVLPSYREGFGTVVVEAAAMGLPTVGSNIYGLSDAVEDGETGVLVPVRNADALTHAIAGLLDDPRRLSEMATLGRSRVERCFSEPYVTKLLVNTYLSLLTQDAKNA